MDVRINFVRTNSLVRSYFMVNTNVTNYIKPLILRFLLANCLMMLLYMTSLDTKTPRLSVRIGVASCCSRGLTSRVQSVVSARISRRAAYDVYRTTFSCRTSRMWWDEGEDRGAQAKFLSATCVDRRQDEVDHRRHLNR